MQVYTDIHSPTTRMQNAHEITFLYLHRLDSDSISSGHTTLPRISRTHCSRVQGPTGDVHSFFLMRRCWTYAGQVLEGSEEMWETDEQEIKAYLAFRILVGISRKPEIRDYWSSDKKLHYAPIASRTTRDRCEEVTRYLHFVENTSLPARGEDGWVPQTPEGAPHHQPDEG